MKKLSDVNPQELELTQRCQNAVNTLRKVISLFNECSDLIQGLDFDVEMLVGNPLGGARSYIHPGDHIELRDIKKILHYKLKK